jgi:hypothetical protein
LSDVRIYRKALASDEVQTITKEGGAEAAGK